MTAVREYNLIMRTLVELYDAEQMLNLIAATQLECDLVVFLYTADQKHLIHNEVIENLITAPTEYMEYSPASLESLLDQIEGDEIFSDVHGGDDLAISIVSAAAERNGYYICYSGMSTDQFYILHDGTTSMQKLKVPRLSVRQIVELYGGKVRNLPESYFDDYGRKAAEECLAEHRRSAKRWTAFAKAIASAGSSQKENTVWRTDTKFYHDYENILENLPHVFDFCGIRDGRCELVFHDRAYQLLVTDIGVPFEYETYYQMVDSKAFDDVDLRVNIDWNGGDFVSGDPNSELDVVASLKGRLISISCKAGKYDQQAIYEVKANADKFGGITSIPVLCADIDMERPEYVEKANELNVLLIEHKEMKKKKAAQMILKWMETH